jgi:hypothetical protein
LRCFHKRDCRVLMLFGECSRNDESGQKCDCLEFCSLDDETDRLTLCFGCGHGRYFHCNVSAKGSPTITNYDSFALHMTLNSIYVVSTLVSCYQPFHSVLCSKTDHTSFAPQHNIDDLKCALSHGTYHKEFW